MLRKQFYDLIIITVVAIGEKGFEGFQIMGLANQYGFMVGYG